MEMSNNNDIPEFHVAQQRRRDKLRVQHFDDLQGHNFHPLLPPNTTTNCDASPMILPSEMLHFTTSHSLGFPFASIHPTRFIAPSCETWIPSYDNDHHVVDDNGRPRNFSASEISYPNNNGVHQNWGNCENDELPSIPHGLSLSLSSNQICEYQQQQLGGDPRELKPFESGSISSVVKQSISSTGKLEWENNNGSNNQNLVPDIGGSSIQVHRNVGPLGPFTGYAAILKSSKFLKPAQMLLDEFFGIAGTWKGGEVELENGPSVPNSRSHNMSECSTAIMVPKSHDLSGRSLSSESQRPDCHERKDKLLHMQEEVCKRHKQYHQQMQIVISAFDSVPGLSNATPCISRSIKTISRHFSCLKNAIADQLKHIKRALGEDFSSPASFLKGDSSNSLLRYDQNFLKARSSSIGGPGHAGHPNHVWRPQRGLPERAVSILRAWLFDHFLHPYPTDNDKQILATQTGLTRNQVSNWFINARVRLWKPMVEEIHMLETKTPLHPEPNANDSVMSVIGKNRQAAAGNHSGCKPHENQVPCDNKHLGPSTSVERPRGDTNTEQLFQKCSRIETHTHQVPANMDSSFIGFLPYQRRELELGGIGAVSLTLGLRHGSEANQQLQHQFLPQGMPFGGHHIIHEFSG